MSNSGSKIPAKIAYVGGGSLNWALKLMSDLAYDTRLEADVRLFDLDRDSAERNAKIGARFADVSRGTPARYTVSNTLQDALTGADVVVISILPGRFEEMAQDIGIPARFGIAQAVGDTVGPGGFVRALRSIPMMVEIAEAIAEHAPDAYVCNLTNPMSVLTGALFATFPEIKAWGECHEVTKIRKQVAWIANRYAGRPIHTHRDVQVNVLGINHFTFVDRISLNGQDMLPDYLEFVADHATDGWAQAEPGQSEEHAQYFGSRNLVAFDLLRRFGIPAAAGDRHLAEFLPGQDYLSDPQKWGFALTPVSFRVKDRDAKRERAEALAAGSGEVTAKRSDEALTDQIAALLNGEPFVSNVNLPNKGQLQGLPRDTIVETNAQFSGLGIAPIFAGELPATLQSVVSDHALRQNALLAAAIEEDASGLFDLFKSDPLVSGLETKDAQIMYNEMLHATSAWLPEKLKGAA